MNQRTKVCNNLHKTSDKDFLLKDNVVKYIPLKLLGLMSTKLLDKKK